MSRILHNRLFAAVVLLALSVPAFSGLYLDRGPIVLPGVALARIVYLAVVALAVFATRGRFLWLTAYVIAGVILLSVVGGGFVLAVALLGLGYSPMSFQEILEHYCRLAVNMATVIPLGLALVSLVPFAGIETSLLQNPRGVSRLEKVLLMALRVFNHVLFAVMPEIVQVVFEELRFNSHVYKSRRGGRRRRVFLRSIIRLVTFVSFTALCNSLEYIHFWTAEISNLPDRRG